MRADLLSAAKQGDESACTQIISENTGLVWSIARRFFGRGTDPDDLFQLGCIGLIKAVRGFDEGYGTQFSTYAVPKILGEIRRFLRDDGNVKVSRTLRERAAKATMIADKLSLTLGRPSTISEIAEQMDLTPEEVSEAICAAEPVASLDGRTDDDSAAMEDFLGDGGMEDALIDRVSVNDALQKLPDREKEVIGLRYFRGLTQVNCAKILNVSQVQISRIEKRALAHLREQFY